MFLTQLALCLLLSADQQAPPPGEPRTVNIAFVLLAESALPKAEDVVRDFRSVAAKGHTLRARGARLAKGPDGLAALEFDVNGATALVALAPVPVPSREADDAARYSISSQGTGWKLPGHKAHLTVTLHQTGKARAVEWLSRFTSLLAAVTQASRAVGVYWGTARATHDPKFFLSAARDPDIASRILLWTGISVAREPGGRLSLLSLGMDQLGLPELLLTAPKAVGNDALPAFFEFLAVLADRGSPWPEGQAVGRKAGERLPVRYVPSPIDTARKVWRVDLP